MDKTEKIKLTIGADEQREELIAKMAEPIHEMDFEEAMKCLELLVATYIASRVVKGDRQNAIETLSVRVSDLLKQYDMLMETVGNA